MIEELVESLKREGLPERNVHQLESSIIQLPEIKEKGWGVEYWFENNSLYCLKALILRQGKKCSIHYHAIKDETFLVLQGKVQLDLYANFPPFDRESRERRILLPGQSLRIFPLQPHQFYGLENSEIIETSTHHREEDSYRLERGD